MSLHRGGDYPRALRYASRRSVQLIVAESNQIAWRFTPLIALQRLPCLTQVLRPLGLKRKTASSSSTRDSTRYWAAKQVAHQFDSMGQQLKVTLGIGVLALFPQVLAWSTLGAWTKLASHAP